MNTAQRRAGSLAQLVCSLACLPALLSGCVNQQQRDIQTIADFQRNTSGSYRSDGGARLYIVPVRSRMVTDESMYIERHDPNGTIFGRLLDLKVSSDGEKVVQAALTFTQEGQWRNLRENPELFTALLPKDVKPAGTCDIQLADDLNSVSYSCGGSPPEMFKRE
jgi:hypothetical protein